MLFQSIRKKIEIYLDGKTSALTAFDELLKDWLNGELKQKIASLGISETEIHIDWLDVYMCMGIQGKYRSCCVDVQIEEKRFSVACDKDEPDEPQEYSPETPSQEYSVPENTIRALS